MMLLWYSCICWDESSMFFPCFESERTANIRIDDNEMYSRKNARSNTVAVLLENPVLIQLIEREREFDVSSPCFLFHDVDHSWWCWEKREIEGTHFETVSFCVVCFRSKWESKSPLTRRLLKEEDCKVHDITKNTGSLVFRMRVLSKDNWYFASRRRTTLYHLSILFVITKTTWEEKWNYSLSNCSLRNYSTVCWSDGQSKQSWTRLFESSFESVLVIEFFLRDKDAYVWYAIHFCHLWFCRDTLSLHSYSVFFKHSFEYDHHAKLGGGFDNVCP